MPPEARLTVIRKNFKRIVPVTAAVAALFLLAFVRFVLASVGNTTVDWFAGAPTLDKEMESVSPLLTSDTCTKITMPVQRSYISAPFEEHCYIQTAMGLMTQLFYTDGAVQAQGYTKAYPVNFRQGGNPIIDPVPNQASGIWSIGWSQGPGSIFGYYPQLSNLLQFKIGATGMYYDIPVPSSPTYVFSKLGNASAPFNSMTKSLSKNGRYMVIDGLGAGFIRINLMNLTVKSFAPTLIKINSSSLTSAGTAIDNTGRYAAVAYNANGGWGSKYFKLVDVNSCANPEVAYNAIPDQTTFNCRNLDLLAVVRQRIPTVEAVGNVQFSNERTMMFDVRYTESGATKYARYSMTAPGQVKRTRDYLALGDSYSSGEGAYSYRDGTDTDRNECHQSTVSYSYLLAVKFGSFASVACSSATIQNIEKTTVGRADQLTGSTPGDDEVGVGIKNYMPGFVEQKTFVSNDNPEAVTISIGGNDIGFGDIVKKCVNPMLNPGDSAESAFTCYDTYEDRAELVNAVNERFTELKTLNSKLKSDGVDARRVYIIGYPQVAKAGGNCGANVLMNASEVAFSRDLISYLNSVIKKAADAAGVFYVDTEHAFDGYRLCEAGPGQAAVNGFTISRRPSGGFDVKASFHPNQRGHQMLADAIAAQTSNLTAPMPAPAQIATPTLDPNAAILQNVPKTGRVMRYVQIVSGFANDVTHALSNLNFSLNQQEYLLKAGGVYNLVINSTPVDLGNFTADAQGKLTVNATLPTGVPPGFHTLHLYGNDMYGNPIDLQQVIFVTSANQDDMDGDGVPDGEDQCALATQSGLDADQDGVDDVCDPLISAPPSLPGGDTGTGQGGADETGIVWWDTPYVPIIIHAISGE